MLFFSPITKKKETKYFLFFSYIGLLLLASFRFGMGDYFNYYANFLIYPNRISRMSLLLPFEPGFSFFIIFFRLLNLSFAYFIVFCAFIELTIIFHIIKRCSLNVNISVFIFFTNYYLIYLEGTLRQGLVLAVFIYAFYGFIVDKNILKYLILICFATLFHVSAIIGLLVPVVFKISYKYFLNPAYIILATTISLAGSIIVPKILLTLVSRFVGKAASYNGGVNIFFPAIGLRLFMMIIVYTVFRRTHTRLSKNEILSVKVYISGVIIYVLLCSISILSRLSDYFMFIEIILLPNLLMSLNKKSRDIIKKALVCVFIVLFIKDLNSVGHTTYQYITIFNKEEIKNVSSKFPAHTKRAMNDYFSRN